MTGTEKSFGVIPFCCTTRVPLEMTVMVASAFKDSFATSECTFVPGATTKKTSLGSTVTLSAPGRSPEREGFDAAGRTKESTGPCPRAPLAQERSPVEHGYRRQGNQDQLLHDVLPFG